jgi:hypothetical protein
MLSALAALVALAGSLSQAQVTLGVSYTTPPAWVVWLEGEDAVSSNWTPGESRHNWWHEYAGVTGRGVLDLASSALPAEGAFVAAYEFELPAAGTYELYWRGRYPGYQACPIYWSINGAAERRQPPLGLSHETGILHSVVNYKMVLADLGSFQGVQGTNRLTIAVRDVLSDNVVVAPGEPARQVPYVVQAIDSLLVAQVQYREPPERLPVLGAGPDTATVIDLKAEVNPAKAEFAGTSASPTVRNWAGYDRLSVVLRVSSTSPELFNGRLRCYYAGPTFHDLSLQVAPGDFGTWVTREIDVAKEFAGVSREAIHTLWLYTYDKWYTRGATYHVEVSGVTLSERTAAGLQPVAVPPAGRPAPGLAEAKARQMAEFVWNEVPQSDRAAGSAPDDAGDAPDAAGVPFAAGDLAAVFSPLTGGLRRLALGSEALVEMPAASSPVQVTFLDGSVWAPSAPGAWEAAGEALVFRRRDVLAEMELRFSAAAGELRCRPVIKNHASQPIARVRFTLWQGARLTGPLLASTTRCAEGTYDAPKSLVSPQLFVHDWFCLYDGRLTLHGRLEDLLLLDSKGSFGRPAAGIFAQIEKYPCIKPGESWTAPDVVLGADRTGTWYSAADRYRLWFASWARRPPVPAWFQAIGGLSVGGQVYEAQAIENNRALLAQARELGGVTLFHSGAWLPLLTEAWYPLNYRLGAAQLTRLAAVTADLRAQGGRLSLYSNALLFSRVTPDYAEYGSELTVRGSDGFPVYSEHDFRHHPMALPWPNAEWAERYCQALEPVIAQGRPDVLYMDQLGAVPTHLDYALERHRHAHYGEWRRVQGEFCATVEKRFRPLQPELVTGIECPNIAAQQYATFALLVYSDYEVLRYTFPHFVNFIGSYAGGLAPDTLRRYAKEAFLSGQPLIFFDCAAAGLEPVTRADIRAMLQLKRRIDPLLYGKRCQTSRGVVPQEGLGAFGFVGENDWLLTYVKAAATTTVTLDPAAFGCPAGSSARAVAADGSDGEPLPVRQVGGNLEIGLPAAAFGVFRLR